MISLRTAALVALLLTLSTLAVGGQGIPQLAVGSWQWGVVGLAASGSGTTSWQLPADVSQPADRSRYREFQLGNTLSSVMSLSGATATDARTIYARPALMQDLVWRPPYAPIDSKQAESVRQMTFSFYNDQLFRIVIDYERVRVEGLTDADMIEAVSSIYGASAKPLAPKAGFALTSLEQESGTSVARWDDTEHAVGLYRSSYTTGFRLIVTARKLDAQARTAATQALRVYEREAPQRELARQKKDADEARALQEKARIANKAAFKP